MVEERLSCNIYRLKNNKVLTAMQHLIGNAQENKSETTFTYAYLYTPSFHQLSEHTQLCNIYASTLGIKSLYGAWSSSSECLIN